MVSRREFYERANSEWPNEVPPLTADEAIRAARKLYRFVTGKRLSLPVKVTTGNRYNYPHGGALYVNPTSKRHGGAWRALLHDLSHWLDDGPAHSKSHARLEARMIREVVRRGWLAGALRSKPKPAAPAVDPRAAQLQRVVARIEKWNAKKKRAERALAKLCRARKRYESAAASRRFAAARPAQPFPAAGQFDSRRQ